MRIPFFGLVLLLPMYGAAQTTLEPKNASAAQIDNNWSDLAHVDAFKAFRAIRELRQKPKETVDYFAKYLQPAVDVDQKAKTATAQRRLREREAAELPKPKPSPTDNSHDLQAFFDEELSRLPEKYRTPIVLCDLEGKTRKEAAAQLGCPEGTIAGRLSRARALLAKRLTQRGAAVTGAILAAQESLSIASGGVSAALVASTSRAAMLYAAGQTVTGIVSSRVAALAAGVIHAMLVTKVKSIAFAALVFGLATVSGSHLLTFSMAEPQLPLEKKSEIAGKPALADQGTKKILPPQRAELDDEQPKKDASGDPLPLNAIARLGTSRLRHGKPIQSLSYSLDGSTLLSTDSHAIHVWDAATGRHLRDIGELQGDDQLNEIAVSADHRIVATSSHKGEIHLWNATTGRKLRDVKSARFPWLHLSRDGKTLLVLDRGGVLPNQEWSLRLIDIATGTERQRVLGPFQSVVRAFAFTKDCKILALASDDKRVRFWDVETGKQVRQLDCPGSVGSLVFSSDNRFLATVGVGVTRSDNPNPALSIEISGNVNPIILWNLETNKEMYRLTEHKNSPFPLAFSPDCKSFISSDYDGLRWWDMATGKELMEKKVPGGYVRWAAFSPDAKTLAMGRLTVIQLWDLAAGAAKHFPNGHHDQLMGAAVSPDGRMFATVSRERIIRLWDSVSSKVLRELECPDYSIWTFHFVPNRESLVTTSYDEKVRIWNIATGKEVYQFAGSIAAASPDGKVLAAYSRDRTVRF